MPIIIGRVARYWNIKPWEFRALPQDHAAELHALYSVEQEIEAYYQSESLRRTDKK